MREDYFTNTAADAGLYARAAAYDQAEVSDYEPEPVESPRASAQPAPTLVEQTSVALARIGADWGREVRMTAEGVCAFKATDRDNVTLIAEEFGYSGLATRIVDHGGQTFVYVRRGPKVSRPDPWASTAAATVDPWWSQDVADKAAQHAAQRRSA